MRTFRDSLRFRLCLVPMMAAGVVPAAAWADSAVADGNAGLIQLEQAVQQQQQQLRDAQQKLDEQYKRLKAQEEALQRQQQQINALKAAVANGSAGQKAPTIETATFRITPLVHPPQTTSGPIFAADTAQAPSPSQSAPITQTEPQQRPELPDVALASQGGVLTPKGVFSLEPSYQYQYASNNQVLIQGLTIVPGITIGTATVRQLVDRMHTFQIGGRLGITNRLEVEAAVPFVHREDSTTLEPLTASGSVTRTDASGSDIGDVQFGAHYQLNSGAEGWPYFVANVLVKSDTGKSPFDVPVDFNTGIPTKMNTGTGFWAIQPSMTVIYPSDPVVFFGNIRYIWNVAKNVTIQPSVPSGTTTPTQADIDPGDGIGGTFGMGFGINDRSSFSLAYEHTFLFDTKQNGARISGSSVDIGSYDLGYAYQISPRTSVNLGIAIGSTKASPDAAVTLRVPVKFQVF